MFRGLGLRGLGSRVQGTMKPWDFWYCSILGHAGFSASAARNIRGIFCVLSGCKDRIGFRDIAMNQGPESRVQKARWVVFNLGVLWYPI